MLNLFFTLNIWLGQLLLPTTNLCFNFSWEMDSSTKQYVMTVYNGEEILRWDDVAFQNDSFIVRSPLYDSEFRFSFTKNIMSGVWINHGRKGHPRINFLASIESKSRFDTTAQSSAIPMDGKWETWFDINEPDSSLAIGVFKQKGNFVSGTFLTETGDHRYLSGTLINDSLILSSFDGSHAWMYVGTFKNNIFNGNFISGLHHNAPFRMIRNEDIALRDPISITTVNAPLNFAFLDLDSNIVSLDDVKFKNKPVIIQLLGSWCPNCIDESKFLNSFYHQRKEEGVEVIGLAFERSNDFSIAKPAIEKLVKRLNLEYTVLYVGQASKENVMKMIPQIQNFISFPTTIYLDRNKNVVKVYAGFSGPATGNSYLQFQKDFNKTMDRLIR